MTAANKQEKTRELINTYEGVRSWALGSEASRTKTGSHVLALIQQGGMAELVVSAGEVFAAGFSTDQSAERSISRPCQEAQYELTHLLTDVALTSVCQELRI